jgi:hypothetical protein
MNTLHHPDPCGPGYRYPNRMRDLAFQLWAFKCSRRLTCVADELAAVGRAEGWECTPGERTLRHWATKGDWQRAATEALRSVAPDLTQALVVDMITGVAEGMPYMRDVLAGRIKQPNSTRIRAILTALSMIGVPDLAHATVREAMRERDTEGARRVHITDQVQADTESLAAFKERIAARLGYGSHGALDTSGAVSPHSNGV